VEFLLDAFIGTIALMNGNRIDAVELARELAMEGRSANEIRKMLEKQGFDGVLHQVELEKIVIQVRAALSLVPTRPSKVWPRFIGIIAVFMGIGGMAIGGGGGGSRYSPGGLGFWAVIAGIVLIIKPDWSGERLK
jgi:hypothetical protein